MEVRKFKPGERVIHKTMNPQRVIEVIKYITEDKLFVGKILSDHLVECVWYERNERKTGVFHQRLLTKTSQPVGLVKL